MTTDTLSTETTTADDHDLVASVRMGEPASCAPFVAHFGPPVFAYLYWLTGSTEEAATAFKDTVLNLYLNPSRVRKEKSVRDWVYRHATQTALTRQALRQRRRRSSLDNILRGGVERAENVPWADWQRVCKGDDDARSLDQEAVVAGLRRLDESQRAALLLVAYAKIPLETTAAGLRLSPAKTRALCTAALDRVMVPPGVGQDRKTRKARLLAHHRTLQLERPRQAAKLNKRLDAETDLQSLVDASAALCARIQELPAPPPPQAFVEETATYLSEGHAALESRMATWGFRFMLLTVPIFIIAILTVILLPAISRSREMARRAGVAENLHQLGSALRKYSDQDHGKRYPPTVHKEGYWVPNLQVLYPEFISDPAILAGQAGIDPTVVAALTEALQQTPPDWDAAHRIVARAYVYTGYALLDTQSMATFIQACSVKPEMNLENDVETSDRRFFRLRQGVEQFFSGNLDRETGLASTTPPKIPVMFEFFSVTNFGGNPEGANVLYLDGTVEYVPFGSAFPVNETVMALLRGGGRRR